MSMRTWVQSMFKPQHLSSVGPHTCNLSMGKGKQVDPWGLLGPPTNQPSLLEESHVSERSVLKSGDGEWHPMSNIPALAHKNMAKHLKRCPNIGTPWYLNYSITPLQLRTSFLWALLVLILIQSLKQNFKVSVSLTQWVSCQSQNTIV